MRAYLLNFILVLLSTHSFAQVNISLGGGYGSYNMASMKGFQSDFASQFPITPKITSSFPSFYTFETSILTKIRSEMWMGANIGYYSTGGRIDYIDYSGEIRSDLIASNLLIGIPLLWQLNSSEKNRVALEVTPAALVAKLDINQFLQVGSQTSTQKNSFREFDLGIQPSVMFTKFLSESFGFYLKTGYLIQATSSKLYLNDSNDYLSNSKGEEVHLNWTGFRISAGVSVRLK